MFEYDPYMAATRRGGVVNKHVQKYYQKGKSRSFPEILFHEVIPLHDEKQISWHRVQEILPSIPRGWYELATLSRRDRIEFMKEFWLSTLPFIPHAHPLLIDFFRALDDVGVFIIQWDKGLSFEAQVVYSLSDDSCFYHGAIPASSEEIALLSDQFSGVLPHDFLQFLSIHNGFSKHTDTGLFRAEDIPRIYRRFVQDINDLGLCIKIEDHLVDPTDLIPFYESFGQRAYQCFFKEWYPTEQVGNLFFSLKDRSISNYKNSSETLAFTTFSDWLCFYLESL